MDAQPHPADPDQRDCRRHQDIDRAPPAQDRQCPEEDHIPRRMAARKTVAVHKVEMRQQIGPGRGKYLLGRKIQQRPAHNRAKQPQGARPRHAP